MFKSSRLSHCRYLVTTLILVISGLVSNGFPSEMKMCFSVSNQRICYFQVKGGLLPKPWITAWNLCQDNIATLPIIEHQEVQKTYEQYLRNISLNTDETWLGGRQDEAKKEWFWMKSNNEKSTMEGNYNNWEDSKTRANGDCLFATALIHRWKASQCDERKRLICQTIEMEATENATTQEPFKSNTQGNLALIVGLSIGIASLAVIIILIVIIANQRRKVRTTPVVTRSKTENEEPYQDLNRITAYENEIDNYAKLTEIENYTELIL